VRPNPGGPGPFTDTNVTRSRGILSWLPPTVAQYIYTVILKPKPLRAVAHAIVKRLIPRQVRVRGIDLMLNQDDAVLCGSIALGCYEHADLDMFLETLRPGMCVVDAGANIGLYAAAAAGKVGPAGTVIAIEPNPRNSDLMRETVRINRLENVRIFQAALSNATGTGRLYLGDDNVGDCRIFPCEDERKTVAVPTVTLDDLVAREQIPPIDVMKIDIQGAEAFAFDGMRNALAASPRIRILMEFWPWGIRRSGRDPAELLRGFRELGFSIYDVPRSSGRAVPVTDDLPLAAMSLFRQYASLLLQRDGGRDATDEPA